MLASSQRRGAKMPDKSETRLRFAPSPTGELHIGGARTALFNYLFAHKTGGILVLRIDDTDTERSRPEHTEQLMSALKWLGLDWDEGPYFQSKRLALYKKQADRLLEEGKAYHCYCSVEELEEGRKKAREENRAYLYPGHCRNLSTAEIKAYEAEGRKPVVRIKVPRDGQTVVDDIVRGQVSFENSDLDDFIIVKSNGVPAYNFASVVDDLDMDITHIIRAEEHLSNTPRQIICAKSLGEKLPLFAHVPMILAPDRSKLSKRHGATAVEEFRDEGFLPEALVNYMSLLGWSPGDDLEFFSLEEASALFELEKVNKTAAIYDTAKLTWMNSHYIKSMPTGKLASSALPWFEKAGLLGSDPSKEELSYLEVVVDALRERARTLPELAAGATYFYQGDFSFDEKDVKKAFLKSGAKEILLDLEDGIENLEPLTSDSLSAYFKHLSEKHDVSVGRVIQPLRLAISGRLGGPELLVILQLLGHEEAKKRLARALTFITEQGN